jgi:hypothetical protein
MVCADVGQIEMTLAERMKAALAEQQNQSQDRVLREGFWLPRKR